MDDSVIMAMMVFIIAIAAGGIVAIWALRYKRVPPNKAMVVYGRTGRTSMGEFAAPVDPGRVNTSDAFRIVLDGGRFIFPVIESVKYLSLEARTLTIKMDDLRVGTGAAAQDVGVRVRAVVRIPATLEILQNAARHLLDTPPKAIDAIAGTIIEGQLRAAARELTPDAFERELWRVNETIVDGANAELNRVGLELVSFHIAHIHAAGPARA